MTDNTQNPGGWPDAARPGYPLNPERDGWHWLMQDTALYPARWDAAACAWHRSRFLTPDEITRLNDYCGPCLLPSEVAAREAAARRKGIEAAAERARSLFAEGSIGHDTVPAAIRALLEDGR